MKKTIVRNACLAVIVHLCFVAVSHAGVILQFEQKHADGKKATSGSVWIGADRMRTEHGQATVIFRGDKQLMWVLNQSQGTYMEMTKEQMKQVGDQLGSAMAHVQEQLKSLPPEQRAMVEKMMRDKMPQEGAKPAEPLRFVKAGKTETINGYACVAYDGMRGDKREQQAWVTDWKQFDLKAADFKVFEQMAAFVKDAMGPMSKKLSSSLAQKYSDTEAPDALPGVPVRVVSFSGGEDSVFEITKIAHDTIPDARFEVPPGMKKEQMMSGDMSEKKKAARKAETLSGDSAGKDQ